jgi:hypothetical protein
VKNVRPEGCWEALLSAVVSCKKCILASCGVLEEESPPGLSGLFYHGGKGRSMGDGPHLGVGNAHFLVWCLSAAFRLRQRLLKIPCSDSTALGHELGPNEAPRSQAAGNALAFAVQGNESWVGDRRPKDGVCPKRRKDASAFPLDLNRVDIKAIIGIMTPKQTRMVSRSRTNGVLPKQKCLGKDGIVKHAFIH